jgi:hypothetical protein
LALLVSAQSVSPCDLVCGFADDTPVFVQPVPSMGFSVRRRAARRPHLRDRRTPPDPSFVGVTIPPFVELISAEATCSPIAVIAMTCAAIADGEVDGDGIRGGAQKAFEETSSLMTSNPEGMDDFSRAARAAILGERAWLPVRKEKTAHRRSEN